MTAMAVTMAATMAAPMRTLSRMRIRSIHSSVTARNLVGPPDPVSNLRPVIYDDALPPPPSEVRHPYSLREFTGDTREYQWKMQRQQLDAFNHAYWMESNSRLQAAKQALLDSLPETYTSLDKESALSAFYVSWVKQEEMRQRAYDAEWTKRNWSNTLLGLRVQWQRLFRRNDASSSTP